MKKGPAKQVTIFCLTYLLGLAKYVLVFNYSITNQPLVSATKIYYCFHNSSNTQTLLWAPQIRTQLITGKVESLRSYHGQGTDDKILLQVFPVAFILFCYFFCVCYLCVKKIQVRYSTGILNKMSEHDKVNLIYQM